MKETRLPARWQAVVATGVALSITLAAGPAMSAGGVDPDADKILRSMSTYLGGLSAVSVNADIDIEFIDLDGQKLQLSSFATVAIERPGKLSVRRRGAFADVRILLDGNTLTISSVDHNAYLEVEGPETIDDALRRIPLETGLVAPGGDLFYADPYPGLVSDVTSSAYRGMTYVNGIKAHYLTFREAQLDWQLWVQEGDTPLPLKYVITSKWVTGAPQYAIRYSGWNTQPTFGADQFKFSPQEGAKKVDSISVDLVGEFMIEEKQ